MKNNKFVLKKLNINLFWSYAIIILLSVLTIGIQMVFQNWKDAYGYLSAFSNPVILLLNWLPVFLLKGKKKRPDHVLIEAFYWRTHRDSNPRPSA